MRALKALLAIQDAAVRHSVKTFLRWEQYDIDTLLEATCTEDVTGLLMQSHIDVIILDMQMTVKPDVTFFRSIKLYSPDTYCILIGTQQDFSSVSQCTFDEVFDFQIKPLNLEQLRFSLARCVVWLNKIEAQSRQFDFVQEQLQRAKTVLVQNLALEIFQGTVAATQSGIEKRIMDLGLSFRFPLFYCVVGDIVSPHATNFNRDLYLGAIRERIRENFPHVVENQVMMDTLTAFDGNCIAVVGGCRQESQIGTSQTMIHAAFSVLKKAFGLDYILVFSQMTTSLPQIPEQYRQAKSACQYYRFVQRSGVFLLPDEPQREAARCFVPVHLKNELTQCIRGRNAQRIPELLEQIRVTLLRAPLNRLEHLSLCICDLMLTVTSLLDSRNIPVESLCGMDMFTQDFFVTFHHIGHLFQWLGSYFQTVYTAYHTAAGNEAGSVVVSHMKKYTQEHYMQPITLKTMAAALHYSANYLGRAFFNSEHIRYSSYLHQVRIARAIELLKTTDLPPARVAEQVGYRDVAYFHQMFRQYTGMTPKAFANQ